LRLSQALISLSFCPDLEILGYNLVHWMSGHLPWMDNLSNAEYVEAQKKGFMSDIRSFLSRCFGDADYPGFFRSLVLLGTKLAGSCST
jgi:hypothetical protein